MAEKTDAKKTPPAPAPETPPVAPSVDDRLAALEKQLAEQLAMNAKLVASLQAGSVNPVEVIQADAAKKRYDEVAAEMARGKQAITQEKADAKYGGGKHRWVCSLDDGNGHPEIVIGAENEVDAAGRYKDVCGILSNDKPVKVVRA